jgi:hypothetical protein
MKLVEESGVRTLDRKKRPTPAPRPSLLEGGEKPAIPQRPASLQRPHSSSFRLHRNFEQEVGTLLPFLPFSQPAHPTDSNTSIVFTNHLNLHQVIYIIDFGKNMFNTNSQYVMVSCCSVTFVLIFK